MTRPIFLFISSFSEGRGLLSIWTLKDYSYFDKNINNSYECKLKYFFNFAYNLMNVLFFNFFEL